MTVAYGGILGVTSNEKHLQLWTTLSDCVRHLTAIHAAWKTDICDEEINPHVRLQHLQPGNAVGCFDCCVAQFPQDLGHQHTHARLVVHDEHSVTSCRPCRLRQFWLNPLVVYR